MSDAERKLEMRFAGGLVEHLGLQMYTGVVATILEFVANAWDADADRVDITIPLDSPLDVSNVIEIRDDGEGMSFDECNEAFLVVGRNRRSNGQTHTTKGRHVLGRKGIGKLAAYGVARVMQVYTAKDGMLTAFEIDYEAVARGSFVDSYSPKLLADRPVQAGDPVNKGTLIRLTNLQVTKTVGREAFRKSLARRFALLDEIAVYVNGEKIERSELPMDFRIPADPGTTNEEVVDGFGPVKWWVGFTSRPIPEDELRGIVVFAHRKLAQSPFFFELSQGVEGQLGMQYMTGEVHANGIDDAVDLIATDRMAVRWEDARVEPLLRWGQNLIKDSLKKWREHRMDQKINRSRHAEVVRERISKLTAGEQSVVKAAISKLAGIETLDADEFDEVLEYLLHSFENKHFLRLIEQINTTEETAVPKLIELVAEWDVLEAIQIAHTVKGHLAILGKFQEMIDAGAREVPSMHDMVRNHPWILNPMWTTLAHDVRIDTILKRELELPPIGDTHRPDFFCMADSERYVIVELKRPGDTVGRQECHQVADYVDVLRNHINRGSTYSDDRRQVVGFLIAGNFTTDSWNERQRLESDGIHTRRWDDLLRESKALHYHLFEVAAGRAPSDPRVERLRTAREVAASEESHGLTEGGEQGVGRDDAKTALPGDAPQPRPDEA